MNWSLWWLWHTCSHILSMCWWHKHQEQIKVIHFSFCDTLCFEEDTTHTLPSNPSPWFVAVAETSWHYLIIVTVWCNVFRIWQCLDACRFPTLSVWTYILTMTWLCKNSLHYLSFYKVIYKVLPACKVIWKCVHAFVVTVSFLTFSSLTHSFLNLWAKPLDWSKIAHSMIIVFGCIHLFFTASHT